MVNGNNIIVGRDKMWNSLNKYKNRKLNILVASLVIFHLSLFVVIPSVTSYALNMPFIRNMTAFFKGNHEISEKIVNSNKAAKEAMVSVSEDGYTFKIDEVKLNKESLIITGSISGPELQYKEEVYPADVEIVPKDFKEGSIANGGGNRFNGEGDTFSFTIEERYKEGVVKDFLSKGQSYITLDVMVYRRNDIEGKTVARRVEEGDEDKRDYRVYWQENDEAIKEFKSIKVPYIYSPIVSNDHKLNIKLE
jgi:hypothetical protein